MQLLKVGIVAYIDAGKTSLTRWLFRAAVVEEGGVDHATMDTLVGGSIRPLPTFPSMRTRGAR